MRRRGKTRFEDLYWHDGIFEALSVVAPMRRKAKGALALDVSLYPLNRNVPFPNSLDTKRVALRVSFSGVRSIDLNCDMPDLAFNHMFGNMNQGRIRKLKDAKRFVLNMFGGDLTIDFKTARVERR
jgi:hypothetical protein